MLIRRPITKEGWLIQHGASNIKSQGYEILRNFSIERLLKLKLVTRNFKTGLTFTDQATSRTSLKTFMRLIVTSYVKRNPQVKEAGDPLVVADALARNEQVVLNSRGWARFSGDSTTIIGGVHRSYMWKPGIVGPLSVAGELIIETVEEPSVVKYIHILNRILAQSEIPLGIQRRNSSYVYRQSSAGATAAIKIASWKVTILNNGYRSGSQSPVVNLYKLLFRTEEIAQVMKSLYRKSVFVDKSLRDLNASKAFPKQLLSIATGRRTAGYYNLSYRVDSFMRPASCNVPKVTEADLEEKEWYVYPGFFNKDGKDLLIHMNLNTTRLEFRHK